MPALRFRNINADPADPVSTWPTEGFITALERGGIDEWARIAVAVKRDPWGPVARRLEDALKVTYPYGVGVLMEYELASARREAEDAERQEVARRLGEWLRRTGMSRSDFAEAIGTSTSRLSTYLAGKVAPSSTLMVRMERVANQNTPGKELVVHQADDH